MDGISWNSEIAEPSWLESVFENFWNFSWEGCSTWGNCYWLTFCVTVSQFELANFDKKDCWLCQHFSGDDNYGKENCFFFRSTRKKNALQLLLKSQCLQDAFWLHWFSYNNLILQEKNRELDDLSFKGQKRFAHPILEMFIFVKFAIMQLPPIEWRVGSEIENLRRRNFLCQLNTRVFRNQSYQWGRYFWKSIRAL